MIMPIKKLSLPVNAEEKLSLHHKGSKLNNEIKLFSSTLAISFNYFLTILREKQSANLQLIQTIKISSMCCKLFELKVIYHI